MSDLFKKLTSHCKEYGFIFQSSEIYDGLGGVYDYGPNGVELKNNIKEYWWHAMVHNHENIVGVDAAILMHPTTWKASGHVDAFNDPLIDNKDSKKRYRADNLIEDYIGKLEAKIEKEVTKARKRFGDDFDETKFKTEHPRVSGYIEQISAITGRMNKALSDGDLVDLKAMIDELEIADPVSGSRNWTEVRQFNLMFSTQLGNVAGEEGQLYLRPETAQGIFVNFLNVQKTTRQKIPFGIAQIGKAFRNEITARQFIFRMREFEQMEMQFFVRPGEEMQWYEYWKNVRMQWHRAMGTPEEKLRFHDHENLAHYANAAVDIECEFPFGFKELEGIHSRTDFDLAQHQEYSGKKLQYFDPELNENYVPYVIETSIGLDRTFLSVLSTAYTEEMVPDAEGGESERTVLKIHPALAPVKCAIMPLLKNREELTAKARDIFNDVKYSFNAQYDEKDAIGRRYRRQDAIGTPYCVTIDFQTLEDNTVTIRERDSLAQERVLASKVEEIVRERVDMRRMF
ncbi:MAG: glycine--tRNA ligase [Saprospiraceae bacterium]|nr:glycine--tRNA ligase [Saprospiraceae bacterium]